METGRFNAYVGALVWDKNSGRYLLLKRSDSKDFAPGIWEFVTGRVNQGETFEAALKREVLEELDVDCRIDLLLGTTHFYRGNPTTENEMIGVVARCSLIQAQKVRISEEHSEYRWLDPKAVYALPGHDPAEAWVQRVVRRSEAMKETGSGPLEKVFSKLGMEID